MADFYGGIVDGTWRVHVVASVVQQNDGAALVRSVCYFQCVNTWSLSGINANYGAKANGQTASSSTSGGINVSTNGSQNLITKDVWVNKGRSGQSIGVGGYINVTGFKAGSSSANGTVSIGAKPSHRVSYNANGGSGAPGAQTKWYGERLNLSGTRPTRAGYTFQGWATSATGGVAYQPGANYTPDKDVTLYAVWKQSWKTPTFSSLSAFRCDKDGNAANDGTYCKVTVKWSVDTKVDTGNAGKTITLTAAKTGSAGTPVSTAISGTSGTFTKLLSGIDGSSSYTITATLTDKHLSVAKTVGIGPSSFILDINADGTGVGIGQAAPDKGVAIGGDPFTVNSIRVRGAGIVLYDNDGANPASVTIPDKYTFKDFNYIMCGFKTNDGHYFMQPAYHPDGKICLFGTMGVGSGSNLTVNDITFYKAAAWKFSGRTAVRQTTKQIALNNATPVTKVNDNVLALVAIIGFDHYKSTIL